MRASVPLSSCVHLPSQAMPPAIAQTSTPSCLPRSSWHVSHELMALMLTLSPSCVECVLLYMCRMCSLIHDSLAILCHCVLCLMNVFSYICVECVLLYMCRMCSLIHFLCLMDCNYTTQHTQRCTRECTHTHTPAGKNETETCRREPSENTFYIYKRTHSTHSQVGEYLTGGVHVLKVDVEWFEVQAGLGLNAWLPSRMCSI